MALIRVIPVVLLFTIFAVQSLRVDDIYKNLISLNGFAEEDVLEVGYVIYEAKKNVTGTEWRIEVVSYGFKGVWCDPNVVNFINLNNIRFIGGGLVEFSKNRPVVVQKKPKRTYRFTGWAANRSHIEVTEDITEIPVDGRYIYSHPSLLHFS